MNAVFDMILKLEIQIWTGLVNQTILVMVSEMELLSQHTCITSTWNLEDKLH